MLLINSSQARELDHWSEKLGVPTATLMQNAGRAVAEELMKRIRPAGEPVPGEPVVFFLGKGNNGGDGRVAARILQQKKYPVVLIPFESELKKFSQEIQQASWLVDALLGVGIQGQTRGWIQEAIQVINRSQKKILSIDIPSGLSADKGIPLGEAVKAIVTVCLGQVKLGCFVHPGAEYAGEIVCADIGIPKGAYQKVDLHFHSIATADFVKDFKKRPLGGHKGDFGHVLVIAGSQSMPGAGFLAAQAALRSGAGLVTYALPETAYQKFDPQFAEVMVQPFTLESLPTILKWTEKKQAVVFGPGLGRDRAVIEFVKTLLPKINLPLVLDADGLFAISDAPRLLLERKAPTLLTPHLGEMAGLLGWQTEEVNKAKVQVVLDTAKLWKTIVILKGYRSLVAFPDGELYVNPTGNPGMATAGMGDVLAGILGGLLAQGFKPEKAALAGVYLHGLAGDLVAEECGEKGLIASDVSRYVPKAIRRVEQTQS